jgi:glutamate--cysteine ligase regulatory subunit
VIRRWEEKPVDEKVSGVIFLNFQIGQLGIADLDVDSLKEIYHSSTVHPTITQINLSACCVVPPPLQEFCNSNDIQLLTHSDPQRE